MSRSATSAYNAPHRPLSPYEAHLFHSAGKAATGGDTLGPATAGVEREGGDDRSGRRAVLIVNMRREWLDGDIQMPQTGMGITHPLSPLNRRLRLEFITGAEEESRERLGRGLSAEELARVLLRYPGNMGGRRVSR